METTCDGILNRRVTIEQPAKGYRVAVDTILLAAAVPAKAGEKALDLGCGVGGAMLALACRVPRLFVTGVEIQSELAELCRRNIMRNKFEDRMSVINADLLIPDTCPLPSDFDHVLMNPPYHDQTRHDVSAVESKRIANTEKKGDLAQWIGRAAQALKPIGTLTLIHRADRLDDILNHIRNLFGDAEILPILPLAGTPPKRVILRAYKGKMGAPKHFPGFVLHQTDSRYTDAAESILRHAKALEFR